MTYAQAMTEAVRRWGRAGQVAYRDGQHVVGTIGGDPLPNGSYPYGRGWTWEEAFRDADRRAALPHNEKAYE
jgi:hypothetical protein